MSAPGHGVDQRTGTRPDCAAQTLESPVTPYDLERPLRAAWHDVGLGRTWLPRRTVCWGEGGSPWHANMGAAHLCHGVVLK